MSETSRSSTPPISQGTVINDRYEIRQSLGKGGMGEVFLAFDRSTQQTVALKIVREEAKMPGDDEAMRQELLHARSVSHPNVCRVHDLAPSPFGPILVMEHIAGQTLHTHIRRRKAKGGYKQDEFRKIASEVCAGLAAIHAQGLVHGDLKPGNVMVTDDKAVILDFGFAQERARVSARRPGAPPDGGTPNYMSPGRFGWGGGAHGRRGVPARAAAGGDGDLPGPRAGSETARQADEAADHVRCAERSFDRRGEADLPVPVRGRGDAPDGPTPSVLQPDHVDHESHSRPA